MKPFSTKKTAVALLALSLLPLAGCAPGAVLTAEFAGGAAGGMYITKPSTPSDADLSLQMAQHENWCYSTLGYVECYTCPQDVPPSRLMNVDPPNRYPLTVRAYNEALAQSK